VSKEEGAEKLPITRQKRQCGKAGGPVGEVRREKVPDDPDAGKKKKENAPTEVADEHPKPKNRLRRVRRQATPAKGGTKVGAKG